MAGLEDRFRAAVALQRAGRLKEAEAAYVALLRGQPKLAIARNNLISLFRAQGRWDDAEKALRTAYTLAPGDPEAAYHLGISLLAAGNYAQGWPLYEARRKVRVDRVEVPALRAPEWRGQDVGSLLIWPEQGFGDELQFARYALVLKARGVEVSLVCKPPLARLFTALGLPIIAAEGAVALPPHEAWALAGSLPLRLGTTLETIPTAIYLPTGDGGGGIGVVTRGRPTHLNDANRSLSARDSADLLAQPGARSLHPDDTGAKDFRDTAGIIADLDLVITVDTSVAHLAGAMGKPVWILLPATGTDWRWLRERADSPWYPTATLFRQPRPGEWGPVIQQVRARLDAGL